MAESDVLQAELGTLGLEAGITSIRRRPGGYGQVPGRSPTPTALAWSGRPWSMLP
jgi:hypothetical protein